MLGRADWKDGRRLSIEGRAYEEMGGKDEAGGNGFSSTDSSGCTVAAAMSLLAARELVLTDRYTFGDSELRIVVPTEEPSTDPLAIWSIEGRLAACIPFQFSSCEDGPMAMTGAGAAT